MTLVMQAKEQVQREQYRRETADMKKLRLCFPSMEGQINCMHSKLMLLSHPAYLRVAVPTANLVPYDWGESGVMENSVFLVDLPRLSVEQRAEARNPTKFQKELVYFLSAMGLEQSIVDSVSDFDFSATESLAFVHTIGGVHTGDSWRRTGYCGLGRAVRELGLATDRALYLDFVTSSVGSLNIDFLAMIYLATQGDDGITEYCWRNPDTGRSRSKKANSGINAVDAKQEKTKDEVCKNFHIYFPTRDTVKASTAGSAGTICFQSKWYNSSTFPRQALRDCKSVRPGLLMHNKVCVRSTRAGQMVLMTILQIIFVHTKADDAAKSENRDMTHTSWVYIGSANCSESAWGRLVKDRVSKSPKLNCRNWECGVLFPVQHTTKRKEQSDLTDFEGVIPVPMLYPGEGYGDRKPWYYSER